MTKFKDTLLAVLLGLALFNFGVQKYNEHLASQQAQAKHAEAVGEAVARKVTAELGAKIDANSNSIYALTKAMAEASVTTVPVETPGRQP